MPVGLTRISMHSSSQRILPPPELVRPFGSVAGVSARRRVSPLVLAKCQPDMCVCSYIHPAA